MHSSIVRTLILQWFMVEEELFYFEDFYFQTLNNVIFIIINATEFFSFTVSLVKFDISYIFQVQIIIFKENVVFWGWFVE